MTQTRDSPWESRMKDYILNDYRLGAIEYEQAEADLSALGFTAYEIRMVLGMIEPPFTIDLTKEF